MKKVSIIIPVYNSENTLTSCIESISELGYLECEAIFIDDGFIDKSKYIISLYAQGGCLYAKKASL